jgi:hypothetical protein
MNRKAFFLFFGALALVVLATISIPACKGEAPAKSEEISIDTLAAVLGKAEGANSGISELSKTPDGLVINYHLYLPEQKDFDALIGTDLAPKIQNLYKIFKSIDKVTFTVETGVVANPPSLEPYCSFDMTRRIYEQTNWTNLLARDLFKICKVNYTK